MYSLPTYDVLVVKNGYQTKQHLLPEDREYSQKSNNDKT
jgi:hypothetical protein